LSDPPRRRSIRLKGYDYTSAGAYFVTVCTHRREALFGEVADGTMGLNDYGRLVTSAWEELPNHHSGLVLDAFVVMPNHVHGIVVLDRQGRPFDPGVVGAGFKPAPTAPPPARRHGLPEIVRAFKTFSARRINERRRMMGHPVWQRGYYEHVVRDDRSLRRIIEYIIANPLHWAEDRENPDRFVREARGSE
jgi:REP element-mobilizing transposase RayT